MTTFRVADIACADDISDIKRCILAEYKAGEISRVACIEQLVGIGLSFWDADYEASAIDCREDDDE